MADDPLHLLFDATTHPDPVARIAAWRDAFSLSVDVDVAPDEIDAFAAGADFLPLGPVLLADLRYTAHGVVRDRDTIARTGREQLILDVFPEGGMEGLVGGRPCVVQPGDCFFMDMRGTLKLRLETGRFVGLIMPRRLVEAALGAAVDLHGRVIPADGPQAALLGPLLLGLASRAAALPVELKAGLGHAVIGMVAALIGECPAATKSARTPVSARPRRARRGRPSETEATLPRLRRHIERHAADPAYDAEALAAAFGLSRSVLYRLMRPEGGVADVIRRRRAALAAELLQRDDAVPLSAVAEASGLGDTRSLRRALHSVYGATAEGLRAREAENGTDGAAIEIGALLDELPG